MKLYSLRLKPGQDLRESLIGFAKEKNLQAASVVTCVGALKPFVLRMAEATPEKQDIRTFEETGEIVSLVGTLTADDCHLHIALSGKDGSVIGGHLRPGSLINLTAEIVLAEDESALYKREMDEVTRFPELVVRKRQDETA